MSKDKKRYRVRDGYSFLFVTEVIDGQGNKHNFAKAKPAKGGDVIEVPELQTRGQEHKLELAEAVVIKCNNGPCGLKFETRVPNIEYAFCPHCGGRGGDILGAVGDVEADPVKEHKPKDKDRMVRARDKVREPVDEEPTPVEPTPDPEPTPEPVEDEKPKKKKTTKKKRKRG